jgi:hypothetical protein
MKQGMMMNTVISAIVGGVIGAAVVFFGAAKGTSGDVKELSVADLKVGKLTITEQASLLNKEGREEVVLKEGSVLAENVVLGKKFIGKQFQGHAFVANRVFTTPDDLIQTPMENWRFFAELGSSIKDGGEVVIRSASGPASVNKPISGGAVIRTGFDPEARPQILALQNANHGLLPINFELSAQQKQMLSDANAPASAATNFNGNASAPSTASVPDPNTMR